MDPTAVRVEINHRLQNCFSKLPKGFRVKKKKNNNKRIIVAF